MIHILVAIGKHKVKRIERVIINQYLNKHIPIALNVSVQLEMLLIEFEKEDE